MERLWKDSLGLACGATKAARVFILQLGGGGGKGLGGLLQVAILDGYST